MKAETVQEAHRQKLACIYLRQSTLKQVRQHQESTERQYALRDKALQLGWPADRILILDRDLGLSGTQMANRPDFQRLVADVSLQKVGAVFALEASRLSRSDLDWHRLVDLCGWTGTLLIDEDGAYNPGDFNDRLLSGLKGTMSQAELHFLRVRLQGAKLSKARKGQLRFPLPVGFVYAEPEGIVLDPDQQVQGAVRLVFTTFTQMASAYGVVQHFAQHQLLFPKRSYGGVWHGQLRWGRLNHGRVLCLLRNPAYAGAYVFGRYRTCKTFSPTGQMHSSVRRMPLADWQVHLPQQHPGYISWEEDPANQQKLAQNQTGDSSGATRAAAREGPALLQGLFVCGRCGRRLSPRYTGNHGSVVWYECNWRRRELAGRSCWSVRGDLLDAAVAQRVLSALVPAQVEIALAALTELEQRDRALDHQWQLKIQRAEYEGQLAQRRFEEIEHLELLKVHLPYHESDHVLNLAYNILAGGQRLEDIELRRQDEVFLNGLGAERIPDPTTAGDFTRRFSPEDIVALAGVHQPGAAGGVEGAAGRISQGSLHRRGRDDCPDLWGVQGGDGHFLQRDLGLRAVDREFGQHQGGALSGQPSGQRRQPQRECGVD